MERTLAAFAPVFAIVYGLLYAAKQPVFIYYPLRGELSLERLAPDQGPAMLWYGWLAAGTLAGLIAAALVPARWATRLPASAAWITALLVMIVIVVEEAHWFG